MLKGKNGRATLYAVLAAALYALNAPCAKLLMGEDAASSSMMAGLLYIGAGLGMSLLWLFQKGLGSDDGEAPLEKKDLPYTLAMIGLDIAAPLLLMKGLQTSEPASASLLNNFEIVATALLALLLFREAISGKLWIAILLVTASSVLLSLESGEQLSFSRGSLLVLGACVCWGFENNCTRQLSPKNPMEIVVIKGFGSGLGAFAVALFLGDAVPQWNIVLLSLLLGFVAYGLSIFFYIRAQRVLGAAKTSAYYAFAPFFGTLLSLLLFRKAGGPYFGFALPLMLLGAFLASTDNKA